MLWLAELHHLALNLHLSLLLEFSGEAWGRVGREQRHLSHHFPHGTAVTWHVPIVPAGPPHLAVLFFSVVIIILLIRKTSL
jgi:hypothetical protein